MECLRRSTLLYLILAVFTVSNITVASPNGLEVKNFPEDLSHHTGDVAQEASCDFESPCLWIPSNNSLGGDWLVTSPQQGLPSSEALHLTADYSVGEPEGHFLLFNASPLADVGHCIFHLTSPVLPGSGPACELQLGVFHPPDKQANLSVQVRAVSSHHAVTSHTLSTSGDMRAQWEVLTAHIGYQVEPFQVTLIYSTCGQDHWGALALDSLQLMDCDKPKQNETPSWSHLSGDLMADCAEGMSFHCDSGGCVERSKVCDFHSDCPLGEDEGHVCHSMPPGSHCSFQSGMCGWSVSHHSASWTLVGAADMAAEGNLMGSALESTPGNFLFLRVPENEMADEALLQSPYFPPTANHEECEIRFSLYLYGELNGSVLLSVEENGTAAAPLMWKRSGKLIDGWLDVILKLPDLQEGFRINMKAQWGPGSSADIALDWITLGPFCFPTEHSLMFLKHNDDEMDKDVDFLTPLNEPSASEVSSMKWWFTSCGASGPHGPTQAQCDSAYHNTNVSVTVGKEGPLKGVQMWSVPATNRYMISAYGAAGGKGARNHKKRSHGVFISAIFSLEKGDTLYILVGHQGEDACPGRKPLTQKICLGESSVIEDGVQGWNTAVEWAGGGGGGGGATYIYRDENGVLVPLLIAAGGGGTAYLQDPESRWDAIPLEEYENDTLAASTNGYTGAAGGGGGWKDMSRVPWAGKSLLEGAEGGSSCPMALSKLAWTTSGGFGGGGGACTAGGGGGGYRGGDAAPNDVITADGQDGVSFIHPSGEIFLLPLAAMESHGDVEIKFQNNCSHCQSQSCQREDTWLVRCLCLNGEELANDNVSCIVPPRLDPDGHLSLPLVLAIVVSTVVTGIVLTCASLALSKRLFQLCVSSVPTMFHPL